jgi:site-specific DNA-cytosine methylase
VAYLRNYHPAYYNEIDPYAAEWLRGLIRDGEIAPGDVDERSIEDVKPDDLRPYTQCHFFAGVGLWSYSLRRARWPDDRPIWTGSCPCQPFSSAGKGDGFGDERHLWPAFYHLVAQRRPPAICGEQVASKDGYAWLDLVQTDMEGLGYAFWPVVLPVAGVGGPGERHRTWWVGLADAACGDAAEYERGGAAAGAAPSARATDRIAGRGTMGGVADAGRQPIRGGQPGDMAGPPSRPSSEIWQQWVRVDVGHGGARHGVADADSQRGSTNARAISSGAGERIRDTQGEIEGRPFQPNRPFDDSDTISGVANNHDKGREFLRSAYDHYRSLARRHESIGRLAHGGVADAENENGRAEFEAGGMGRGGSGPTGGGTVGGLADAAGERRRETGDTLGTHPGQPIVPPYSGPGAIGVAGLSGGGLGIGRDQAWPGDSGYGGGGREIDARPLAHAGGGFVPQPVGGSQGGNGNTAISAIDGEGADRPGPLNGFWRNADWLFCTDGKWRPVEPGTRPLAYGLPLKLAPVGSGLGRLCALAGADRDSLKRAKAYRVGTLKGYGNAISPEPAIAFIESWMDYAG